MKSILLLSVCALAAAAAAQQGPLGPRQSLLTDYALLQREDQGLVGRGRTYRAHFTQDHVEFVAAVPQSPSLLTLRLHAEAAGRGSMQPLAPAAAPVAEGRQVRYARGAVDETYDVLPDGLEQSFVFRELPAGDGDLVVDVRFATDLPLAATGDDSVLFATKDGGAEIRGVVGRDAAGRSCAGGLTVHDDVLSLRLPAAFVASATLPLVLDPLINSRVLTNTNGGFVTDLAASFDATSGSYLAVWCFNFSNTATEIRGVLGTGQGASTPLLINASNLVGHLTVANNNMRNAFVVAWDQQFLGPLNIAYRALVARSVQTNGTLGPVTQLTSYNQGDCVKPQLASNADTAPTAAEMALVYLEGVSNRAVLRGLRLDTAGSVSVSPVTPLSNPLATATSVGITRVGDGNNRYLICWGEDNGSSTFLVRAIYTQNGTLLSLVFPTSTTSAVDLIRIDGDAAAGEWAVIYGLRTVYNPAPWVEHVWMDNGSQLLRWDHSYALPDITGSELPVVAMTPRFVHTVHQSRYVTRCLSTTPNCWESTATVLTRSGCRPCAAVADFAEYARPALLRPASYGLPNASPEDVKLIYTDAIGTSTHDVYLVDFTHGDGPVTDLGGGCGGVTARAGSVCAHVGGTVCIAQVEGLPANGRALLLIGTDRLDARGCGSCVLVPNPFSAFVVGPMQALPLLDRAETEFTIPNDPGLVGLRLYEQWLIQDNLTPGCASFPFDLSNALQVTVN